MVADLIPLVICFWNSNIEMAVQLIQFPAFWKMLNLYLTKSTMTQKIIQCSFTCIKILMMWLHFPRRQDKTIKSTTKANYHIKMWTTSSRWWARKDWINWTVNNCFHFIWEIVLSKWIPTTTQQWFNSFLCIEIA